MPRIPYEKWKPGPDAIAVIRQANAICASYAQQGYDLTLRQLYYQFVARDLIPNSQQSYKRLGSIVNKARLAGLLDWDYIVDRTRNLESLAHWRDPAHIVDVVSRQFRLAKWERQPTRVEVWVEKEALAGVISRVADRHDVPWFSCRGYVSQSELWAAARRFLDYIGEGQNVVVLHLGDHDPSGIDMSRDIADRLEKFIYSDWADAHPEVYVDGRAKYADIEKSMLEKTMGRGPLEVRRIALTWEQVQEYQPPPNPAKMTDSRVGGYLDRYGDESWELDALDPATLDALIEEHVEDVRDQELWDEDEAQEEEHRELLGLASARWAEVVGFLQGADEAS